MTDSLTKQYFVIEEFNGIAGRVYAYSAHRGVYSARMSVPGLGRVKTTLRDVGPGSQEPGDSQAVIAAISGLIPTMFMTRVRL
jgi:hypothetical protein